MVTGSLARRYARAILEIGTANGSLDKLGGDLRSLAKAMHESAELVTALINPAIRRASASGQRRTSATSCTCCSTASGCRRSRRSRARSTR